MIITTTICAVYLHVHCIVLTLCHSKTFITDTAMTQPESQYLVWSIDSVLHCKPVVTVLLRVATISGLQTKNLVHPSSLPLEGQGAKGRGKGHRGGRSMEEGRIALLHPTLQTVWLLAAVVYSVRGSYASETYEPLKVDGSLTRVHHLHQKLHI